MTAGPVKGVPHSVVLGLAALEKCVRVTGGLRWLLMGMPGRSAIQASVEAIDALMDDNDRLRNALQFTAPDRQSQ